MSVDHPLWEEHQHKCWMRPDADRWLKPTYEPKTKPAPEPAPTADVLAAVEEARREHLRIKSMLIDLQIDLFRRELARKYDGQPRDELGRWASDGGTSTDLSAQQRSEAYCWAQLTIDNLYCAALKPAARRAACRSQAMQRYAACLRGQPRPPLPF